MTNLLEVTKAEVLDNALKEKEDRLNVLFFWADWHEPCHLVAKIVDQLAKENPTAVFLKIEAEKQPDVTRQYPITSVPTLVFIKGGKTLEVLENAPTHKLVAAVEKHNRSQIVDQPPLQAVEAASNAASSSSSSSSAASLKERLTKLVKAAPVMLFMKGAPSAPKCGFSRQTVEILRAQEVPFGYFDILTDNDVRQGLKEFSNWKTFPQLYISGKLVGGLDVIKELIENDEFKEMIPESGLANLKERLEKLINQQKVMLFMKGSPDAPQCGFSRTMVGLLNEEESLKEVGYGHFDILTDSDVRQGLKDYSNWKTYPQLYVDGKLVGGLDVVREMQEEGELEELWS